MKSLSIDAARRSAAFSRVAMLEQVYGDSIPWYAINEGCMLGDEMIYLASKAGGIFKPSQFARGVLSIKTTEPRMIFDHVP